MLKELNENIRSCRKCRLSETRKHALCGEGNKDSKIMLIAQAPGENEDIIGRMFIGPSGGVLNELFRASNISRSEIYMTNLIKCMLPKYRKPKQDEIEICGKYLNKEIELINPPVLCTLGFYATRYIFQHFSVKLPPKSEFGYLYGKLFLASNKLLLPLQHPAALLYDNSIKELMIRNYHKIKVLLTNCKWYPMCPMKRFYEEGRLSKNWIELFCKGDWESCIRYQMEDRGEAHPDSMLPDGSIDERLNFFCSQAEV